MSKYIIEPTSYTVANAIEVDPTELDVENIENITYETFNGSFDIPFSLAKDLGTRRVKIVFDYYIEYSKITIELRKINTLMNYHVGQEGFLQKKNKVLFVGIFKDVSKSSQKKFITFLDKISVFLAEAKCLLVTNDEEPSKHDLLLQHPKVKILNVSLNVAVKRDGNIDHLFEFAYHQKRYKYKTYQYMAFLRNLYIDQLKHYMNFDSVCMMDIDMDFDIPIIGILKNISHSNRRRDRAISSNGVYTVSGEYWDRFALRMDGFNHVYNSQLYPKIKTYWDKIIPKRFTFKTPTLTFSSFGGLSLYDLRFLVDNKIRYDESSEDCEHIGFHKCFDNIVLDPHMLYLYTIPHIAHPQKITFENVSKFDVFQFMQVTHWDANEEMINERLSMVKSTLDHGIQQLIMSTKKPTDYAKLKAYCKIIQNGLDKEIVHADSQSKEPLTCENVFVTHYKKLDKRLATLQSIFGNHYITPYAQIIKTFDKEELYVDAFPACTRRLITIITPTYNQGKYISKTLQSIESQSYKYIEHIILDNESTDETRGHITKYMERNKTKYKIVYIREKDFGQVNAINRGILMSKGEIITWLNSDDYYANNHVLKTIESNYVAGKTDILYGLGYFICTDGQTIDVDKYKPFSLNHDPQSLKTWFVDHVSVLQPSTFIARSVFEKIGLLNDDFSNSFDYEFWIRAANNDVQFTFVNKHLAFALLHDDAKSIKLKSLQIVESMEIVYIHYDVISHEWVKRYCELKYNNKQFEKNIVKPNLTNEEIHEKVMEYIPQFREKFRYSNIKKLNLRDVRSILRTTSLSLSEISLYLKHLYIFYVALTNNLDEIIVFEDDVFLCQSFCEKLNYIMATARTKRYDICHFCNNIWDFYCNVQGNQFLYDMPLLPNTAGYFVNVNSLANVFNDLLVIDKPIDLKLNGLIEQRKLKCGWVQPNLCSESNYETSISHTVS